MKPSYTHGRRHWLALAAAATLGWAAGSAAAQTATGAAAIYQPTRGQAGKDVIWIATPDTHVERMLRLANAKAGDVVMDLGSGDGKIVLAAAKQGLRSHGVEYNPDLVTLSQRLAREAGLEQLATFEKADLFDVDLSKASIITMYLLPELNLKLRPKLLELQPGTRIVSHDFRMGKWQPDETTQVGANKVHLWVIPANAGGMWEGQLPMPQGAQHIRLHLMQHFQKLEGAAMWGGLSTSLRETRLLGDQVHLAFTDANGALRRFQGKVSPTRLEGMVDGQPFSAQRVGTAPAIQGSGPVPPEDMEYIQ